MQFRCYTCHHLFHEGLPPLEALSDQQMGLVQGSRTQVEDVRLMLVGTTLEGLGAANFCDPCLSAIVDNPLAWRVGQMRAHELKQNLEAVWCSCGVTLATRTVKSRNDVILNSFDWEDINRLQMRHRSDAVGA